MKAQEKHKLNTFSISEIIKAKQKEFTSNHNSLKETNSALTKTKDYSKEDNILQNTFSGKFSNLKKSNDNNRSNFSKHNQFLFKKSNKSYLSNGNYNNNFNNNKSVHSKNVNLKIKNIEDILKYKDDANFSDSKYCDSRLDKISNDKTNVYANYFLGTNNNNFYNFGNFNNHNNNNCNNGNQFNSNIFSKNQKSKKTFSGIQHKFKRSSLSSKFLNLYLGDIKNNSKDDFTDNNTLTEVNINVHSLLFKERQLENKKEKEFENITMLNISDSDMLDDIDEFSRIKINRKINDFNGVNYDTNYHNENKNSRESSMYKIDKPQNVQNISSNNITSKFFYAKNRNKNIQFNSNSNKDKSKSNNFDNNNNNKNNTNEFVSNKIKKNLKNLYSKNNLNNCINYNSIEEDVYISCFTDENQIQNKREDNTVVNLFNFLNFSDADINYRTSNNNINLNFSNLENENAFLNSNNINNDFLNCEINELHNGCYQHSGNFNKISSKSFKGSLSGISKITTIKHRNKHNIAENEEDNRNIVDKNKFIKNINFNSSGKLNTENSRKKFSINNSKKLITNDENNKLSNISILSIKSDSSEMEKCSVLKYNKDEEKNNTVIYNDINDDNNQKDSRSLKYFNQNNSDIDMSYYASDVDEVFYYIILSIFIFQ